MALLDEPVPVTGWVEEAEVVEELAGGATDIAEVIL